MMKVILENYGYRVLDLGKDVAPEKIVEAAKAGHGWKNPVWRNADGTVAEW